MLSPLTTLLESHGRVVLDGGLASELEARGADLNDPLWSARILLEQPELIRAVHLDYFRAGADAAITASYQASIEGFARRGLSETEALELIARSVRLAQEARVQFWAEGGDASGRPYPFVAGSIGPYGAFLADGSEYRGDYGLSKTELIAFHRPRMRALIEAGADILACETIPCLEEAEALVDLLAEYPQTTAWISFSARDEKYTNQGESIADCAALLDGAPQVVAVGVNCTAPRFITGLVREIASATSKPIVVYPNSGERYDPETRTWLGETSCDAFGEQARAWYGTGARVIGGCCRTSPEHILHVVDALA